MTQFVDLPDQFYNAIKLAPCIIDWTIVLGNYHLSDLQLNEFLPDIMDYEDCDGDGDAGVFYMYKFQKLSINFIEQNINSMTEGDWDALSLNDNLLEEIIDEYIDNFNWNSISFSRKMNIDFIKKYSVKINFKCIMNNFNISKEIKDYCKMFL